MSSPRAYWAFGVTLGKATGDVIASLTNINGLDVDSDEIDITSHDSPGGYEEVIQSIRRTGTVTVEGNFNPADDGQAALMADYLSGDVESYEIDFTPTGLAAKWEFDAFVKKAPSTEAPVDGQIPFSAELRVTGEPALALDYADNFDDIASSAENIVPEFDANVFEYFVDIISATNTNITASSGTGTVYIDGAETGSVNVALSQWETRKVVIESKEDNKITRVAVVHVSKSGT